MNCPVCNIQLNMMERSGVEIDYCSKCRGVWLDRGELDKIIERSADQGTGFTSHNQHNQPNQYNQSGFNQQQHYPDSSHYGHHKKHKKRESFLSDLFDFD